MGCGALATQHSVRRRRGGGLSGSLRSAGGGLHLPRLRHGARMVDGRSHLAADLIHSALPLLRSCRNISTIYKCLAARFRAALRDGRACAAQARSAANFSTLWMPARRTYAVDTGGGCVLRPSAAARRLSSPPFYLRTRRLWGLLSAGSHFTATSKRAGRLGSASAVACSVPRRCGLVAW